jgi:hypothetical protein
LATVTSLPPSARDKEFPNTYPTSTPSFTNPSSLRNPDPTLGLLFFFSYFYSSLYRPRPQLSPPYPQPIEIHPKLISTTPGATRDISDNIILLEPNCDKERMSSVRTRRQAAAVSTPKTPSPAPRGQVAMNGNGPVHGSAKSEKENIFLFWPNIIGQFIITVSH